ncbi:MAG: divalent-cation tolerance protein CutA [Gammaproteobacteria bacterium]
MSTNLEVILCTFPDRETAEKTARLLVEKRLAACVNIMPGLTSIYAWQDKIEAAQEHLLLIKSSGTAYQALEAAIVEHHPYELPEILSIPVKHGLPGYLHWINSCLSAN